MVSSGLKYYFVFPQITENSSYIRIIKRVYQLMNQLKNLEIGVSYEKCNIYILIQYIWGLPQTLLGFIVLLINIKNKHYFYHGAIITERKVHEYGHTIQSLIFGPLYLIVMGIPSALWGFLPYFQNKRNNGVSYFSFFKEKFANYLGEKVTKENSMENAII